MDAAAVLLDPGTGKKNSCQIDQQHIGGKPEKETAVCPGEEEEAEKDQQKLAGSIPDCSVSFPQQPGAVIEKERERKEKE